jgi:hypothetical protein
MSKCFYLCFDIVGITMWTLLSATLTSIQSDAHWVLECPWISAEIFNSELLSELVLNSTEFRKEKLQGIPWNSGVFHVLNSEFLCYSSGMYIDKYLNVYMYGYDSPTERRKTERRMTVHRLTQHRKTQHRMTEHRMTEHRKKLSRKIPITEWPNAELDQMSKMTWIFTYDQYL